jgi:N4-gp56 family major capsid protein
LATTSTVTTNFGNTVTNLIAKKILLNLRANYAHAMPGNYRPEQFYNGTNGTFVWTTYPDQAAATTALTEGSPPTSQALTITTESASAVQVGGVYEATDLALLQSPHNLLAVGSDHAADQAAKTIDVLVRDIIAAGASVIYSGSQTSRANVASSHALTGAGVKRMVEELQTGNVRPFADGSYRAIIHPRVAADLQRDTSTGGYMDIFKYSKPEALQTRLPTANYAGVQFIVSTQAKIFTGGSTAGGGTGNVFASLFFGEGAYGIGWEQPLNAYFVPAGGDHSDPIAQLAKLGWKTALATRLFTGPGAMLIRNESGATNG